LPCIIPIEIIKILNLQILYSKKTDKFLDKNSSIIKENEVDKLITSAIKKILKIEDINVDVKMLKGELKEFFRIRKGNIRIIFIMEKDNDEGVKVFINAIDFRGDIYK